MNDNFSHHSDDWSHVPRPEVTNQQGYGRAFLEPTRPRNEIEAMRDLWPNLYGPGPRLSVGVAYVLWLLFGLIGAHYFYINKPGLGVLWLLTGGLLGIGWFIDLFTLKGQVERANRRG